MTKAFAGTIAVRSVDLDVRAGEVLAVVGANGAGKSTLMNILAGAVQCDSGLVEVNGQAVKHGGVREALGRGIALVHQELNLADNLSVEGNLALGSEPTRWGFLDQRRIRSDAKVWLERVGLDIAPGASLAGLSMGKRQLIEIAKALSRRAKVLILDEPTSSLSASESARLLRLMRTLASEGVAIVFITHRIDEVLECADRVVMMRDGECVGELAGQSMERRAIVSGMIGASEPACAPDAAGRGCSGPQPGGGEPLLVTHSLRTSSHPLAAVDLRVHAGEVVGIAGVIGAGRTELLRAIFGIDSPVAGEVWVAGQRLQQGDPQHGARCGVALVPEDRKHDGLLLDDSGETNGSLVLIRRESQGGFIRRGRVRSLVAETFATMRMRRDAIDLPVAVLSGGNQQKVVLAKWLLARPKVLLLDDPTRGVDIAARAEIHTLIRKAAGDGAAVLCASNDGEELLALCDRVLVMREGAVVGELASGSASKEALSRLSLGEMGAICA